MPFYVFFDYKDVQNQTAKNMITSLLKQLVCTMQSIPVALEKLYDEDKNEKRRPSLDGLVDLFIKHAKQMSCVILFDAFDECGEQGIVRSRLIQRFYNSGVKVFITHRPHVLTSPKSDFPEHTLLEIQARDEDIEGYIDKQLRMEEKAKRLDDTFRTRIIDDIKQQAKGM
jgi:hypothetical protein